MREPDPRAWPVTRLRPTGIPLFTYALWIQYANIPVPPPEVPDDQWQGVVGRRLLTPAELAARRGYFERRTAASLARFAA